jgi:nickel/cobalt transporter (NicO) family protein
MAATESLLLLSAAGIGVVHTLLGPDHYLPFAAMGRAFSWSRRKTIAITAACGAVHVASSVALGLVGVAFGFGLSRFEAIDGVRGTIAAWLLIAFGLVYLVWGLKRAARGHVHSHVHPHHDGTLHDHRHDHEKEHLHAHTGGAKKVSPWMLFTIFLLGPCEPMIPLLLFPAATSDWGLVLRITGVFGVVTVVTMIAAVLVVETGLRTIRLGSLERYGHAIAGGTILMCGVAIEFVGL